MLAQFSTKFRPKKLTWPQLLELFKKARIFEGKVSQKLITLYKASDGFSVFNQIYLKVNGAVSIVDDLIYNSNTKKWILNESKFGTTNQLTKNQKIIQDAIKGLKSLEIRTARDLYDEFGNLIAKQGDKIKVDEILRSHSVNGSITNETIKTTWKKQ